MTAPARHVYVATYSTPQGPIIYPVWAYLYHYALKHAEQQGQLHGWKLTGFKQFVKENPARYAS